MTGIIINLFRNFKRKFYILKYRLYSVHPTSLVSKNGVIARDIVIGEHSYIGPNGNICQNVIIGKYVMLGPNVSITGKDHRYNICGTPMIFSGREKLPKTIIEDDVWIGTNTIIMAGVKIGFGSIIGAGSIVTKDIPSFQIYAGNPAKKIRSRFSNAEDEMNHRNMLMDGLFEKEYARGFDCE